MFYRFALTTGLCLAIASLNTVVEARTVTNGNGLGMNGMSFNGLSFNGLGMSGIKLAQPTVTNASLDSVGLST